ncbi:MAG: hypothetical protein R3321_00370 [Nitrososphaeraceae archaeon]|nr:hypothetical protein [Nitrososphaeraceae archaeon]
MKRLVISLIAALYAFAQVLIAIGALTVEFLTWVNNLCLQLVSIIPIQNNSFVDDLYDQFIWSQNLLDNLDF